MSRSSEHTKALPLTLGRPNAPVEREAERAAHAGTGLRSASAHVSTAEPPGVHELLPSTGDSLDPSARAEMESRFHFDFGRVRVHHDTATARTAQGLLARAFAVGRHVAFGAGGYAPQTAEGRQLLAHELAHVVQQADHPEPVVRRDSKLKGKMNQQFGDRDASDIDDAIAASPVGQYIPVKKRQTLKGNVDTQSPSVFEQQFKQYGLSQENPDEVPGFVNRKEKKPIKLRLPGRNGQGVLVTAATFEAAVHETIHINSQTRFQDDFGHAYNEGVTEYFTELVFGEEGKAYRGQVNMAKALISALGPKGEEMVAKGFFEGDRAAFLAVLNAFNQNQTTRAQLRQWDEARLKDPPDWAAANRVLTSVFAASTRPGATPAPPLGRNNPAPPPPQ
jgi:hypothetical protein